MNWCRRHNKFIAEYSEREYDVHGKLLRQYSYWTVYNSLTWQIIFESRRIYTVGTFPPNFNHDY